MKAYRQGDVIIYKINKIPENLDKSKSLTLAEGEVTGHSHRINKGTAEMYIKASLGLMYLKVLSETATLYHEEHEEINLPMGEYEVKIQREFDWFNEEIRRVVD